MNYWFVARANELFIDTDNVSKSIRHTRARLQGAIECGKLDVAYVMSRPSKRKDHLHTIVTIKDELSPTERYVWEIILHGDIYRGCCNIMRYLHGVPGADVLISPYPCFVYVQKKHSDKIKGQSRKHDDSCDCIPRHNAATMATCPAAIRLRGENKTRGFFGKPSKDTSKLDALWPMPTMCPRCEGRKYDKKHCGVCNNTGFVTP